MSATKRSGGKAEERRAREVLETATARWPQKVLRVLSEAKGPLRFSRVIERIDGISQKTLTQALRKLERDGLITRTYYEQAPPRVEYEITDLGKETWRQMAALWGWIIDRLPDFKAA